jgi:hypothetical protein
VAAYKDGVRLSGTGSLDQLKNRHVELRGIHANTPIGVTNFKIEFDARPGHCVHFRRQARELGANISHAAR